MTSRRQQRVDELLRRELAEMLVRGEIKDPRLEPSAAISITGVDVSPDLANARVFVDVFSDELDLRTVLLGLRNARGAIRRLLGKRVHMKRLPQLHFEHDESVGRGARIAAILGEIAGSPAESDSAKAEREGERDGKPD